MQLNAAQPWTAVVSITQLVSTVKSVVYTVVPRVAHVTVLPTNPSLSFRN